jgi:ATP-dependent Clp protease ATP-binding subunit ClpC
MNWLKALWKALNTPVPRESSTTGREGLSHFTPRALRVLDLSRQEAVRLEHYFVGTEHLLLGMIALGEGVAANVLSQMGIDLPSIRALVEKEVGTGPGHDRSGDITCTPRVKKILALATKEAKALSHTYVGTEHILLGILREGDGVAARVLMERGLDLETARQHVLRELEPNFSPEPPPRDPNNRDTPDP